MKRAKAAAPAARSRRAPTRTAVRKAAAKPKSSIAKAAKGSASARAAKQTRQAGAKPPAAVSARPAKSAAPAPQRPVELHYWPTPNGWKIAIMLEECGLPYTVKFVNIGKGEQFDPAFLQISPNNRIPAIVDPDGPDGKPIAIFESGAILQYLGRKSGKLYPADERGRVEVDQWLFWQVGGLGPMAGQANHFRQIAPEQLHYAIERYTRETERLYKVLNARLAGREFIASRISIADVACWGWIVPHRAQGQTLDDHPHLKAWFDRMAARPAVQRGFKLGSDLRRTPADAPRPDEARKGAALQRPRP